MRLLIVYSTIDGHTLEICERIAHFAREARPNAFFSVNAVGRKPHKRQADTNPYVRTFLRQIRWKPQQVEAFARRLTA